jgi:hypothetical protein
MFYEKSCYIRIRRSCGVMLNFKMKRNEKGIIDNDGSCSSHYYIMLQQQGERNNLR